MLLTSALCPPLRARLWDQPGRALRLLNLGRHLQAVAEQWRHARFQSVATLRPFLSRACASAPRLVATAARKRPTSAQLLRQSGVAQNNCMEFTRALAA